MTALLFSGDYRAIVHGNIRTRWSKTNALEQVLHQYRPEDGYIRNIYGGSFAGAIVKPYSVPAGRDATCVHDCAVWMAGSNK